MVYLDPDSLSHEREKTQHPSLKPIPHHRKRFLITLLLSYYLHDWIDIFFSAMELRNMCIFWVFLFIWFFFKITIKLKWFLFFILIYNNGSNLIFNKIGFFLIFYLTISFQISPLFFQIEIIFFLSIFYLN